MSVLLYKSLQPPCNSQLPPASFIYQFTTIKRSNFQKPLLECPNPPSPTEPSFDRSIGVSSSLPSSSCNRLSTLDIFVYPKKTLDIFVAISRHTVVFMPFLHSDCELVKGLRGGSSIQNCQQGFRKHLTSRLRLQKPHFTLRYHCRVQGESSRQKWSRNWRILG